MTDPSPLSASPSATPYQPVPRAALHPPAADLRATVEVLLRLAYPQAVHPFTWASSRRPSGCYEVQVSTPTQHEGAAMAWGFSTDPTPVPPEGHGNRLSAYGPEGCDLLDEHMILTMLVRSALYLAADRVTTPAPGNPLRAVPEGA
jgi:hypothetical protein